MRRARWGRIRGGKRRPIRGLFHLRPLDFACHRSRRGSAPAPRRRASGRRIVLGLAVPTEATVGEAGGLHDHRDRLEPPGPEEPAGCVEDLPRGRDQRRFPCPPSRRGRGAPCGRFPAGSNFFAVDGSVRICHATGSAKNPYAILQVSSAGCVDGHAGHPGDYVPTATDLDCHGGGCFPLGAPVDPTIPCCDGMVPLDGVCSGGGSDGGGLPDGGGC
jgi:hypothetical protein